MTRSIAALLPARLIRPTRANQTQYRAFYRLERACRQTDHYRGWRGPLRQIPPVDLEEYFEKPGSFLNPAHPAPELARIDGPWGIRARTVTLATWFRAAGAAHLDRPTCESLERARPEALAGTADVLGGVAQAIRERRLQLRQLRGIIVIEGIQGPLLPERVRSEFWKAFQVPVTRQMRGFAGELLGSECECQEGLHVDSTSCRWEVEPWSGRLLVTSFANLRHPVIRLRTRLLGELTEGRCGCGADSMRLMRLAQWTGLARTRPTAMAVGAAS